jgi:hypothetical protein
MPKLLRARVLKSSVNFSSILALLVYALNEEHSLSHKEVDQNEEQWLQRC